MTELQDQSAEPVDILRFIRGFGAINDHALVPFDGIDEFPELVQNSARDTDGKPSWTGDFRHNSGSAWSYTAQPAAAWVPHFVVRLPVGGDTMFRNMGLPMAHFGKPVEENGANSLATVSYIYLNIEPFNAPS